MKALQVVFGVPQNKVILAVSLLKKPATRESPEPLVSREVAPLVLEIHKQSAKQENWAVEPWAKYTFLKYAKRPCFVVLFYGREITGADQAAEIMASPWHELAAAA